ncbi:MAG TPA: DNA-deoxyinosine glycosylase [Accumulibacter sp.]|jgi:hypoxanthine-DNA glycosylase|nr:DNA-deoxyinosine glycosylase [Accumulibacter sp.]HQC81485.1 DNA-deoxyinosine glycosylase [Accumulibacter sp.]
MADGGGPDLLHGLPPIVDAGVRTLILGSFPSPASLAAGQYYGHRQNQFWRLLGAVLDESLATMDYVERQRRVLSRGVGIWDVYRCCRRQGALDSAIQEPEINDFSRLCHEAPELRRVCFNGQTAGKRADWFARQGYQTAILPSSSPAYTLAFESKLARWRAAGFLEAPAGGDAGERDTLTGR